jgi:hypothetical protein
MAQIIAFPLKAAGRPGRRTAVGNAEIVLFPGIRVEYHDPDAPLDLSRRPGRPAPPAREESRR